MAKKPRKWTEFEIDTLIEILEERVCLWDVSCKAYHMRDKREKAYTEIKEALDISVVDIKTKITSLRAQLGREIKISQGRQQVTITSQTGFSGKNSSF